MITRQQAQPAWEKIVDLGFADYEQLTREQRVWFNVEPLTTDGIVDHYCNPGGKYNSETIEDLEYLGCYDISDMMRKFNQFFPNGVPPKDLNERYPLILQWNEEQTDITDEIENEFWKRCESIEAALLEHINRTGIGILP